MHPIKLCFQEWSFKKNFFSKKTPFSSCRVNRRRKTIIHRNQYRNHIQEVVQVGAVGNLEEEEAEGVGLTVAVDGDNSVQEALVPMTHL